MQLNPIIGFGDSAHRKTLRQRLMVEESKAYTFDLMLRSKSFIAVTLLASSIR
jgi:hypothetical protein